MGNNDVFYLLIYYYERTVLKLFDSIQCQGPLCRLLPIYADKIDASDGNVSDQEEAVDIMIYHLCAEREHYRQFFDWPFHALTKRRKMSKGGEVRFLQGKKGTNQPTSRDIILRE